MYWQTYTVLCIGKHIQYYVLANIYSIMYRQTYTVLCIGKHNTVLCIGKHNTVLCIGKHIYSIIYMEKLYHN